MDKRDFLKFTFKLPVHNIRCYGDPMRTICCLYYLLSVLSIVKLSYPYQGEKEIELNNGTYVYA